MCNAISNMSKHQPNKAILTGDWLNMKLSVQLFNEMRRRKQKYGMVTMCVGSGQGAASVFELLN